MSQEKEYFHGLTTEPARHDRLVLVPRLVVLLLVLVGASLWAVKAFAEPIFQARSTDGLTITVYSEACRVKGVTNLPKRVVWAEKGKTYEACLGVDLESGVAIIYREDQKVFDLPVQAFIRVVGA